jgi:hypothetical protein
MDWTGRQMGGQVYVGTLRPAACTALMCAGRNCRIFFEPYRVINVTRPGWFNGSSVLKHARACVRACLRVRPSCACVRVGV